MAGAHIHALLRRGETCAVLVGVAAGAQPMLVDPCVLDDRGGTAGDVVDGRHHRHRTTGDRGGTQRATDADGPDLLARGRIDRDAMHVDMAGAQVHGIEGHAGGVGTGAVGIARRAPATVHACQRISQAQRGHGSSGTGDRRLGTAIHQVDDGTQADARVDAPADAAGVHVNLLRLRGEHADVVLCEDIGACFNPCRDGALHPVDRHRGCATDRAAAAQASGHGADAVALSAGRTGRICLHQ